MADEIMICLYQNQWDRLKQHLPEDVCPKDTTDLSVHEMLDCRPVNEATYQQVLDVAKKNCPDLVREIEKAKHYP
jgi:hypothetical protein